MSDKQLLPRLKAYPNLTGSQDITLTTGIVITYTTTVNVIGEIMEIILEPYVEDTQTIGAGPIEFTLTNV